MIILSQEQLKESTNPHIKALVDDSFICRTTEVKKGWELVISDRNRGLHINNQKLPFISDEEIRVPDNADNWREKVKKLVFKELGEDFGNDFLENYCQVMNYIGINVMTISFMNEYCFGSAIENYLPSSNDSQIKWNICIKETVGRKWLCIETIFEEFKLKNGTVFPGQLTTQCEYQPERQDFVLRQIACTNTQLESIIQGTIELENEQNIVEFIAKAHAEEKNPQSLRPNALISKYGGFMNQLDGMLNSSVQPASQKKALGETSVLSTPELPSSQENTISQSDKTPPKILRKKILRRGVQVNQLPEKAAITSNKHLLTGAAPIADNSFFSLAKKRQPKQEAKPQATSKPINQDDDFLQIVLTQKQLKKTKNTVIQQVVKEKFVCAPKEGSTKGLAQLWLDIDRSGTLLLNNKSIPGAILLAKQNDDDMKGKAELEKFVLATLESLPARELLSSYSQVPSYILLNAIFACAIKSDKVMDYWPDPAKAHRQTHIYTKRDSQGAFSLYYEVTYNEIVLRNGKTLPGPISSVCEFNADKKEFILTNIECTNEIFKSILLRNNYGKQKSLEKYFMANEPKQRERKLRNRKASIIKVLGSNSRQVIEGQTVPSVKPHMQRILPEKTRTQLENMLEQKIVHIKIFKDPLKLHSEQSIRRLSSETLKQRKENELCSGLIFDIFKNIDTKYSEICDELGVVIKAFRDPRVTEQKLHLVKRIFDIISEWYKELNSGKALSLQQIKNLIINATIENIYLDNQKSNLPILSRLNFNRLVPSDDKVVKILMQARTDEELPDNSKEYGKLGKFLAGIWQEVKIVEAELAQHAIEGTAENIANPSLG